jgi:hypothetical protein
MLHYLLDYGAFQLGAIMYILLKAKKLKELGEANPDPNVAFNWTKFRDKESINIAILLLGGIALVIFTPLLIGGATVDIKSTDGGVVATLALQTLLAPFYFLMGLAGPSALLNYFGSYEKTLLNRMGVDPKQSN